ncbi:MAG: class I SAM-dependent methyltransferase, partial [Candidatus Omnitrophica bacterium]|nr:class I SAM-dependent methyltransferase [Candidatus Omnitrophota bacterium]
MATLDIDGAQRYLLVSEICDRLGVDENHTVLDVGGGTGRLVQYLKSDLVFTVDPYGDGENHIRASMEDLPIPESSYDVVIQIDSLEHVPDEIRERALREMSRVAERFMIWIGPVDSELAVEAEEDLCASHREFFAEKEMEWLSEHRIHGLPSKDLVTKTLNEGMRDSRQWMSFPLRKWWTYMRLDQQLEAGMFQPELEKEIDRWYEESGWKSDFRVAEGTPGYRFVFVGSKKSELPWDLDSPPKGTESLAEWRKVIPLIDAIALSSPLDHQGLPQDPRFEEQLRTLKDQLPRSETEGRK